MRNTASVRARRGELRHIAARFSVPALRPLFIAAVRGELQSRIANEGVTTAPSKEDSNPEPPRTAVSMIALPPTRTRIGPLSTTKCRCMLCQRFVSTEADAGIQEELGTANCRDAHLDPGSSARGPAQTLRDRQKAEKAAKKRAQCKTSQAFSPC